MQLPIFNGSLVKQPLNLGHKRKIASHTNLWIELIIHVPIGINYASERGFVVLR